MPLDHYVTLGRSGLRVSPLCLGGMTFGLQRGWGSSVEDSQLIIDRYLEQGGNFIDTANSYNLGDSEQIIGDHVTHEKSRRDRVVVATKFSANLYDDDPNGGGGNRKSVIAACEQSLRRLQTDYIDLYWMHWWDKFTPIEETMAAMDSLVTSGKVRYIGFSNTPGWKVAQAQVSANFLQQTPLIALQMEYSLLERTVEGELLPLAEEFGLGVTPWSPLKAGILSGKYTRENLAEEKPGRGELMKSRINERMFSLLDLLQEIAARNDTRVACVALAWLRSRRTVSSIIIGARTLEQLEENLASLEVELPADDIEVLDELTQPRFNYPTNVLPHARLTGYGGLTINGESFSESPWVRPTPDKVDQAAGTKHGQSCSNE